MSNDVEKCQVTGEQVQEVMSHLQPILEQYDRDLVIITGLTMALVFMHPEIEPQELHDGVEGASQWVCEYLNAITEPLDSSKVN